MVIRTLLPLSGTTNLYQFAKEVTGLPHPHRTELFKFPSFKQAFYALPEAEQDMLWQQLAVNRNGTPRDLAPYSVISQEYVIVCRFPAKNGEYFHDRAYDIDCPHWYLREQLALRFEDALKSSGDFMRGCITSYTDPDTNQARKRIFYADALSNDWCRFMRRMFISDLPAQTYALWLDDPRFTLLMVHERNAASLRSRGEPVGAAHASLLCHSLSKTQKLDLDPACPPRRNGQSDQLDLFQGNSLI